MAELENISCILSKITMPDLNPLLVQPTSFGYFNVYQKHGFEDVTESIALNLEAAKLLVQALEALAY